MQRVPNTCGNTFTEVKTVETSPSGNWYRTGFVVLPIQAYDTPWITTPMPYSANHVSPTHLTKISYQMINEFNSGNQPKKASLTPVDFNDQYAFNFLEQLHGTFWDAGQNGGKLQIILPGNGNKQCAIVRRVCSAGEDRLIYEEGCRFTLCSLDDDVEAVVLKSGSSTQLLTWWRNDGKPMHWRRSNENHEAMETGTSSPAQSEILDQELSGEPVCDSPEVPEPTEDLRNDLTNWSGSSETSTGNSARDQKNFSEEIFRIFRT